MGKPGGFFKKLKAKQKRAAAKNRRGTKGASKEDRRLKHNERVAFYAAKRQAEELAEVSSSSDDEPSTDSEAFERQEEKKLRRLRSLLGVAGPPQKRQRSAEKEQEEEEENEELGSDGDESASASAPSATGDNHPSSADDHSSVAPEEDWNYYLGNGDDEDDEDADADDADASSSGADMLFDAGSSEDDDGDEGSVENPFMALAEEEEGDETEEPMLLVETDGDDEQDEERDGEEEEEEEEEEEDHEDAFVEDDDADDYVDGEEDEEHLVGTPKTKKERRRQLQRQEARERQLAEESQMLLPHFQLGTSSAATIERSAAVQHDDPWLLKYHLDQHGDVDRSPLQAVALSHTATEQLAHSNDALREAAAELEERTTRKERGVFHVSAEEYARLHPENVTVAMTAHAQQHLLHPPFSLSAVEERPPYVHEALWGRWVAFRAKQGRPVFTAEERGLFDLLQGYADLMDCTRGWQCATSRREIFVLHLLNHWFKARSVVLAHDRIIEAYRQQRKQRREAAAASGRKEAKEQKGKSKKTKKGTATESTAENAAAQSLAEEEDIFDSENYELRDRGFGKTRLFVMLPMRNIALQYVKTMVEMLGADPLACPKLETFVADFSEMEEAVDPTFVRRPPDYQRQFDGNIDDSFCVGLHLEPSRVHLYAHPLNSDIILCSPLGLRRRVEKSGDVLVSLSSIEVCLMDEAHVLLMQNWDHAAAVFEMLNKRPTDTTHGLSDLRRVYAWALNGKSGRHRQTILCSDISHATLLGALRASLNSSGKVLLQRREEEGAVAKVTGAMRQHFLRFDTTALDRADDDRFEYFTKQVFASKLNSLAERDVRIILLVPSYFDFVRLRNYLYREYRDTFAPLSEYSTLKQQRRALGQFSDLERPILLVTERFYFFKRYFVKRAEVMVFYSPPLFPEFYSGLLNRLVATSPNAFALTLYCRYDTHELNRLVGTNRTRQLLERESGMFSFVTS